MDNITISAALAWLLAVAAGLVTLSKGWEIVRKFLHPEADLREIIKRHSEMLDSDNRRIKKIEERQEEIDHGISVLCQTQLAMLNHELTGNDVEHLRIARDKMNDYLISRH